MLNQSHSKVCRSLGAEQKLQKKITRKELINRAHLNQLSLDLAQEWTGVSYRFEQHLYVE
jgi:hypothetical protein